MKKLLFGAVVVAFAMTSCKKDYTCSCDSSGIKYEYTLTESKKSAAAAVCEGKGIGGVAVDGVAIPDDNSTTCTLK
jgi:hypothetical protein